MRFPGYWELGSIFICSPTQIDRLSNTATVKLRKGTKAYIHRIFIKKHLYDTFTWTIYNPAQLRIRSNSNTWGERKKTKSRTRIIFWFRFWPNMNNIQPLAHWQYPKLKECFAVQEGLGLSGCEEHSALLYIILEGGFPGFKAIEGSDHNVSELNFSYPINLNMLLALHDMLWGSDLFWGSVPMMVKRFWEDKRRRWIRFTSYLMIFCQAHITVF